MRLQLAHARLQAHPGVAEAHALAIAIHKQTRHFGRMGYSHLRSQLTRAAFPTWQGFNDETIEIRKMIFVYRRKVLQSPRNRESDD
jgi:hypothetical protein